MSEFRRQGYEQWCSGCYTFPGDRTLDQRQVDPVRQLCPTCNARTDMVRVDEGFFACFWRPVDTCYECVGCIGWTRYESAQPLARRCERCWKIGRRTMSALGLTSTSPVWVALRAARLLPEDVALMTEHDRLRIRNLGPKWMAKLNELIPHAAGRFHIPTSETAMWDELADLAVMPA